jgi:ribosome modulation factor
MSKEAKAIAEADAMLGASSPRYENKRLASIYRKGVIAALMGKSQLACPYSRKGPAKAYANIWDDGWRRARSD